MSFATYYPPHLQHMLPASAPPLSPVRLDTEKPLAAPPPPPVTVHLGDDGAIADIQPDTSLAPRRRRAPPAAAADADADDPFAGVERVAPTAPHALRVPAPSPPAGAAADREVGDDAARPPASWGGAGGDGAGRMGRREKSFTRFVRSASEKKGGGDEGSEWDAAGSAAGEGSGGGGGGGGLFRSLSARRVAGGRGGMFRSLSARRAAGGGQRRRRLAREDVEEVRELDEGEDLFGGSGRKAFGRVAGRTRRN